MRFPAMALIVSVVPLACGGEPLDPDCLDPLQEGAYAVWLWEGPRDDVPPCPEARDVLWDGVKLEPEPPSGSIARACAGVVQKEIPSGFELCVMARLRTELCREGYEDQRRYVEDEGRNHVLCCASGGSSPALPAVHVCP
ncbi:hypothetical protein BE17_19330 [Sorangium cellulosum]|uniref:Uncharacterized protein n=1 Tax=Sorangium cellulosum TaxID=56 RepID=A0A150R386_SORCE|nr:hypothetical protein BE17_19330 [Sorangium cellulosum]